jgi:hypothetical protein
MNLTSALAIIRLCISLLPEIRNLVVQVEKLFPEGGSGSHKLAVIRGILDPVVEHMDGAWDVVENIIASIVTMFNAMEWPSDLDGSDAE